jgi:hypothetical protein
MWGEDVVEDDRENVVGAFYLPGTGRHMSHFMAFLNLCDLKRTGRRPGVRSTEVHRSEDPKRVRLQSSSKMRRSRRVSVLRHRGRVGAKGRSFKLIVRGKGVGKRESGRIIY